MGEASMGEVGKVDDSDANGSPAAESPPHRRRPPRWILGGGAAVLALVVAVGAYSWAGADDADLCDVLSRPAGNVGWLGQFIVFMEPDASDEEIESVEAIMTEDLGWADVEWVDQSASLAEFQEIFADKPDMLDDVEEASLPPSFRAVLLPGQIPTSPPDVLESAPGVLQLRAQEIESDADVLDVIGFMFASRPGSVATAFERRIWESGWLDGQFGDIELEVSVDGQGGISEDLVLIDRGLGDILAGNEPDSAVVSATDRVLAAHAEQCEGA